MLSILIPIYNYNTFPLVFELQKQCMECKIDFEILCQDDASGSELNLENEKINSLEYCSFISLKKNVAHRENRNLLAEKAKNDYLLFIDGDSIIISENYIYNYISNLYYFDVIYGGRIHPDKCPSDNQKLRWKYGKYMEDKLAINRMKKPYSSMLFNNTLIKKECFNKVKFDKELKKYGHDDTQLSYQLSLLNVSVNHIENPVEHGDIETNLNYYNKSKESIETLLDLYKNSNLDSNYLKILKLYAILQQTKIKFLVSKLHLIFEKIFLKNLTGSNPSLLVYNIFRIGYMCSIK
jgi:Glycosyl transferase family 2